MNKKRIAILAAYAGIVDRGAEAFVIEFTKNMRNDFDITVFSMGVAEEIKENTVRIDINNSKLLRIHQSIYKKNKLYKKICDKTYYLIPSEIEQRLFSKKVYKNYLLKEKYDLIFPNNGVQGVKYADKIRNNNGTPFIYTGHGGNSIGETLILKYKPDLYIALTERYLKVAESLHNKTVKIHNGIDVRRFEREYSVKDEHKSLPRPVILCVGAFTDMKRQKLLIEAVSFLKDGFLILIGDGEKKQMLEDYCSAKIPGRYLITRAGRDEIVYYYHLCDVFSLPSKDEPFGIVYLEAMACNKPVVTTLDEDRKEIIGDAGILCNVESPRDYSNAITECFLRDWDDIPMNRVKTEFSQNKIFGEYRNVINEVISGSGYG